MSAYRMPEIEVGQLVNWFPDGDNRGQKPHAAIVTAIGNDTVCVTLFEPHHVTLPTQDGVRHVTDERAKQHELRENGAWDYTARDKDLAKMLAEFKKHKPDGK